MRKIAAVLLFGLCANLCFAGGPLRVGGPNKGVQGVPFVWDIAAMPIQYRVDSGAMSISPTGSTVVSNAQGLARVQSMFGVWQGVSTAAVSFNYAGPLQATGSFGGGHVASVSDFSAVVAACSAGQQTAIMFGGGGTSASSTTISPAPTGGTATPQLVITTSSLPDAVVGKPYNATATSTGGTGKITWSLPVGSMGWLTIDSNTGVLSGTPTTADPYGGVQLIATDSGSPAQKVSANLQIYTAAPLGGGIPPYINGLFTRFVPGSYQFQPGGKRPLSVSVTGGNLPPGITASVDTNSQGWIILSGTPTAAGMFNYTLNITDSVTTPQSISVNQSIVVDSKMTITAANLPYGIAGRAYSGSVTVVNATPPLKWYLVPPGLVGDDQGNISGTPTAAAQWTPELFDSSSTPQFAVGPALAGYLFVFDALRIPRASTASMVVGRPGSVGIPVIGGVSPFAFSLQSGALPPGLTMSSNGISGTPTQLGTFKFGVHVTDSAVPPEIYDEPFSILVQPPPPSVGQPPYVPAAAVGHPYSFHFDVSGGTPPFIWSNGADFPPGLAFDSAGNLAGIPMKQGSYQFGVSVTDSSNPAQKTYPLSVNLVVRAAPLGRNDSVATASPLIPAGASISPYSDATQSSPDTDYYRGLGNGGDTISILVQTMNNSPLDPAIEIVDGNGQRFQTCNDPALKNPPPPIVPEANWGNFADECINDDIDLGVNISSQLDFKVPGPSGSRTAFYLHVFDVLGNARPHMAYDLNVSGPVIVPLSISADPPGATRGVAYFAPWTRSGGLPPITFQVAPGSALPPGLQFTQAGGNIGISGVTGTPTTNGTYSFTVVGTDSDNPPQQASATAVIRVADAVTLSPALPAAATGVPYSQSLMASGGVPPYQFSSNNFGSIKLDSVNGMLSGLPTMPGNYTSYVTVTDFEGRFASGTVTLPVVAGSLLVASTALPSGTVGWAYDEMVPLQGGTPPYAFIIINGAIPPGMSFDPASGDLRGIPTTAGNYAFTVKIVDAGSPAQSITVPVSITIQ